MKVENKPLKELFLKYIIKDKESIKPKGKQIIIEKYTKLIMQDLYGEFVHVFFCDFNNTPYETFQAIFRTRMFPPPNTKDYTNWLISVKPSITYNTVYFKENDVPMESLFVIVHEVTHYEIGMNVKKENNHFIIEHSDNMDEKVNGNCKKINKYFDSFHNEVGIDMGQNQ